MCFFFQAEDGIRDLVRSRGLGDVYKRQQEVGLTGDVHPRPRGSVGSDLGGIVEVVQDELLLSLIHI